MAAPRGFLSCHRSVVHAALRSAHARERQSSPNYDLRNCPSWSWIDDLTAQRTTGVRIRVDMSTDEKRPERYDLNVRGVRPRCAWNADFAPSRARSTHGKRRASAIQERTVVLSSTSLSPGARPLMTRCGQRYFDHPCPPLCWVAVRPARGTKGQAFFADKGMEICAPEQWGATMRSAKL